MATGARVLAWIEGHRAELRLAARMTAAGLAAFVLAESLHLAQGYWAVLTAVVVIQGSVGGSLKASLDRFLGTLSGALWGAAVAFLPPRESSLALGVAVLIAIAPLAVLAATNASFRVAPISAVIVLLGTSSLQAGPLASAMSRVLEIGLGCVVGFVVSLLVLPAPAASVVAEVTSRTLGVLADLLAAMIAGLTKEAEGASYTAFHARVRAAIAALETGIKEAQHERRIYFIAGHDPAPLVRTARRLHADLLMTGRAAANPLPEPMRSRLEPRLTEISETACSFLRETGAALAARSAPPSCDAMNRAFDGYAAAMGELRRERLTQALSDDEAERIFTLGFGLEQLRRDLSDLAQRTEEFARPAPRLLSGRADTD